MPRPSGCGWWAGGLPWAPHSAVVTVQGRLAEAGLPSWPPPPLSVGSSCSWGVPQGIFGQTEPSGSAQACGGSLLERKAWGLAAGSDRLFPVLTSAWGTVHLSSRSFLVSPHLTHCDPPTPRLRSSPCSEPPPRAPVWCWNPLSPAAALPCASRAVNRPGPAESARPGGCVCAPGCVRAFLTSCLHDRVAVLLKAQSFAGNIFPSSSLEYRKHL